MSKARNLADVISGAFDVPAGALDNAPTPTLSSLGIANHDQITVSSGGVVTNANNCRFQAYRNGGINIADYNGAVFPFNAVHYDVGSNFDVNNFRFNAPVSGYYYLAINLTGALRTGGALRVIHGYFRLNGGHTIEATMGGGTDGASSGYSVHATLMSNCIMYMNAGDYADWYVGGLGVSGGNQDIEGGNLRGTRFYGHLLG